jgi:uncharacterized protein (DUF1778 family)
MANKPQKRVLDTEVRLRVREDQRDFLFRAAEDSGQSGFSNWARPILLKAAEEQLKEARPQPPRENGKRGGRPRKEEG